LPFPHIWWNGKITGKQLVKRSIISVLHNCAGWAGAGLGALIGSFVPGIGTIICAGLGASLFSLLASYGIKWLLEKFAENPEWDWEWSDKKQYNLLKKEQLFRQALDFFNLSRHCTELEARNARGLHYLAYHPEKGREPNAEKFIRAFEYYAIIRLVRGEEKWHQPRPFWDFSVEKSDRRKSFVSSSEVEIGPEIEVEKVEIYHKGLKFHMNYFGKPKKEST